MSDKKKKPQETVNALPHNAEAERSVLGAVLVDNNAVTVAREILEPEDFFHSSHVHIFGHMTAMADESVPVDLVTLTDRMQREGELELGGGAAYIAALGDGMPRVTNVYHHARIVKEKSLLRSLIHFSSKMQQNAFEEENFKDILSNAHANLSKLMELDTTEAGPQPIKTIVHENYERLEKTFTEGRAVTGVTTGYLEFDKLTCGLQPQELIILAARPSVGKSALALNIAENLTIKASLPQPVLICSLEMSRASLLTRLLSAHLQVDVHKFRSGHISREEWKKIAEGLAMIAQAPLWIDDSSNASVAQLHARADRIKRNHGLKLMVVDYLQLLSGAGKFGNRQEEVAGISRSLKAMSKSLDVPVLALSQLKRTDRDDRGPQLSDLRESGAIEQDADVVVFLHRPKMNDSEADLMARQETEVIVAKQRNGPTDMIKYVFRSNYTRFEERYPEGFDFDRQ